MKEVVNLNAGPAGLPRAALELAQKELLDFEGTGISIVEHSHRGAAYDGVHQEVLSSLRELMAVPDTHEILLIQGGASHVFALLPMNFISDGGTADYVLTGAWSKKALAEAKLIGDARSAGTGEVDGSFIRVPSKDELSLTDGAAYVHMTSNNTIAGTQYHDFFETGSVPLVADMSSDIMWRSIDVSKFAMIYAGAQKNIGPSGLATVIVRKDWIEQASSKIPKYFRFKTHLDAGSLYNTPPTFAIYLMRNVLRTMKDAGGVPEIEKRNRKKAEVLYGAIDGSAGFFRCPVETSARSVMNVVFRLPSEDLEAQFIKEAAESGIIGLKGHRSVGGCRASIYNAVQLSGVERLVDFMHAFQKRA